MVAYQLSKRANREFDEARYVNALKMATSYYEEAFNTGAPQAAIANFFEVRSQRKAANGH